MITLIVLPKKNKELAALLLNLYCGWHQILSYVSQNTGQLQVGIGHNFQMHATGWKWKLTTCLGGDGVSRIRNKTSISPFPGMDFRFGWRADYVLPEITGYVNLRPRYLISGLS